MADDTGSAADEELRPGSALEGMLVNGKKLYTGIEEIDFTIRLDNKIVAGTNVVAGISVPAAQVWVDTSSMGNNIQKGGLINSQEISARFDRFPQGIDGSLDTTKFRMHLKDAGVTTVQGLGNYLDQKIMGIDTPNPDVVSPASGVETTDFRITVANWDDETTYTVKILAGRLVEVGEGAWDWELPDVLDGAEDHTIWFSAKGVGRDESDLINHTISVEPLTASADQVILFEGATMTDVEFPVTNKASMANASIKGLKKDASAESLVVEQEEADNKFVNAKPTSTNTSQEYTIKSGATNTSVDLTGMRLSDGDTVMVGGATEFVAYNTTNKVSVTGGGSTDKAGANMTLLQEDVYEKNSWFGQGTLAMNSTKVLVGAHGHDGAEANSGCVYLYDKANMDNELRIEATVAIPDCEYGKRLAITETHIYVGCGRHIDADGVKCGAVYVYDMDGSNEKILMPSDPVELDYFGASALVVTDTNIYVGAHYKDVGGTTNCGCLYMYDIDLTNERKILAPSEDRTDNQRFGWAAAVQDDLLLVGATRDEEQGDSAGCVYRCDLDGTIQHKMLMGTPTEKALYGASIAISPTHIAIGAAQYDDEELIGTRYSGAVFLYDIDGSNEMMIVPENPVHQGGYGMGVALGGSKLAICHKSEEVNGLKVVGMVRTFDLDGGNEEKILAPEVQKRGYFGFNVTMDEDIMLIGALRYDTPEYDDRNTVFKCASGAGPIDCTLDLGDAGLADAPTVVAKNVAVISTSLVKTGRNPKWEERTVESCSYDNGKIEVVYDQDKRVGEDFQVKVDLATRGAEVTKIEIPIDKAQ